MNNDLISAPIVRKDHNERSEYTMSDNIIDIFNEDIPKKQKYHISDMDITFDKGITQEEMEGRFFDALRQAGVIGHRGCPS